MTNRKKQRGKKRRKKVIKANTDHIAHQVNVTGVGTHKDKSKLHPRIKKGGDKIKDDEYE